MKLSRRKGRLRLRFLDGESALIAELFGLLEPAYEALDRDDEVVRRLYPSAHPDDPGADAGYRELTEATLRDERYARLAACRAELGTGADIDLSDPDVERRWLQVLNDLRLALGTRLGITADDDGLVGSADDPRMVYYWLTEVQDSIVTDLMGDDG